MTRLARLLEAERTALRVADGWPKRAQTEVCGMRVLAQRLGITRVADLTGLDRMGCHVVQTVRPTSRSNVVSQGKGSTLTEAAQSAVMEAAEAWAAERVAPVLTGTAFRHLPDSDRELLDGLETKATRADWREQELDWVDADDVGDGVETRLPIALVTADYRVAAAPPVHCFVESTTGLGAGFSFYQASLHALLECIERDAVARARRTHGFFESFGIDLESADGEIGGLVERLRRRGCLVGAWAAPARAPVAAVWCWIVERDTPGRLLPFAAQGMACALDPLDAIRKALLEAAQARVSVISGAREDITRHAYRLPSPKDKDRVERMVETIEPMVCVGELPSVCLPSSVAALDWLIGELGQRGVGPALGVALAAPNDLGVAVVRIVVPGLLPLAA